MIARPFERCQAAAMLLAAGVVAACTAPPYHGPMRGTWSVAMTLETGLPGRDVSPGTTVSGRVTVPDPRPITPHAFPDATPADVRLDLHPFGLWISGQKQPVVRDEAGGGVRLRLGSAPNELVLVGRLAGDSVTGTWSDDFRSGGAAGRFVMRRKGRGR